MVKVGGYKINNIYEGGFSSLKPDYGNVFTGYRASVGSLGITTNPSNAAITKEFSDKANLGVETIELETLDPKTFDAMPKQYFKEIDQMSKLTGVDVSFHGPLVEPSGLTQNGFTEATREAAERQIAESLERVHDAIPNGGIVNFHTSNFLPSQGITKTEDGTEVVDKIVIINTETGTPNFAPIHERSIFGEDKEWEKLPVQEKIKKEIESKNNEFWEEQRSNLAYYGGRAIHDIEQFNAIKQTIEAEEKVGNDITAEQQAAKSYYNQGVAMLNNSYRMMKELYRIVRDHGDERDKRLLMDFGKGVNEMAKKIEQDPYGEESVKLKRKIIEQGIDLFNKVSAAPQIVKSADEFMVEKTSMSFGNAAFKAFKKFKDKAPTVVIENPPANQQFSRGSDVRNIVEGARKQFVAQAMKSTKDGGLGLSESEAEKQSEKLIGASWDVGHINMLRQAGYSEEDIITETGHVAEVLKHVHLSDNFGFEHTELPMGMGNVPIKQIMEKLGKKGFEAKKIIEAGDWWTKHVPQGAKPPFVPSLEGLGSPIYSSTTGVDAPYWNQTVGLQQGYNIGLGEILPQQNFNLYGAGFSQLPRELGGQVGGGSSGSRMSGRPME